MWTSGVAEIIYEDTEVVGGSDCQAALYHLSLYLSFISSPSLLERSHMTGDLLMWLPGAEGGSGSDFGLGNLYHYHVC